MASLVIYLFLTISKQIAKNVKNVIYTAVFHAFDHKQKSITIGLIILDYQNGTKCCQGEKRLLSVIFNEQIANNT